MSTKAVHDNRSARQNKQIGGVIGRALAKFVFHIPFAPEAIALRLVPMITVVTGLPMDNGRSPMMRGHGLTGRVPLQSG
jgi:hypothetical protein